MYKKIRLRKMKMSIKKGQGVTMKNKNQNIYTSIAHNIYYHTIKWYFNIQHFLCRQSKQESLRNLIMLITEAVLIFTAISTILIVGLAL
tara:strand:- start:528 stop:794 length:267 start_codon:yes stop_codon:yes gene_type:complete